WMWPDLPEGVENAEVYFVQDYLMPPGRLAAWRRRAPLQLVGPIETATAARPAAPLPRARRLLVNFSGCANPLADPAAFGRYVDALAAAIVAEAGSDFESIVFCCNRRLAARLEEQYAGRAGVRAGHFPHDEFLRLLAASQLLLSAPGITTTLEAIALETPVR